MMNVKNKLASVLARAFSPKAAPNAREQEAKASKKMEDWLKSSRMRSLLK